MIATIALTLLALPLPAQAPMEPAKDLFMHSAKAPGIEIRWVDYHWQPALFEAMEKGTRAIPEATRNWVVARVIVDQRPFTLGSTRIPVGNYALVLWPNLDGKGMKVEVRYVDMREVYPSLNAIAPAPRGETYYEAPAPLETASPLAARMDMALEGADGPVVLSWRYGDRRFSLRLTR
jgi:hypothetical protein